MLAVDVRSAPLPLVPLLLLLPGNNRKHLHGWKLICIEGQGGRAFSGDPMD